jgi:phage terminase small subunit
MKTYNRLRARLRAFVRAYVETGVGAKSLRAIGFTGTRPDVAASKLLAKPKIREAIAEYEAYAVGESKARIFATVLGLEQTANLDPRRLLDSDGLYLPLDKLPDDICAAIQGIDVEELYEGRGSERKAIGVVKKYKFAPRNEARKLLLQYKGMLADVHKHQQLDANGNPITPGPTFVIAREEAKQIAEDLDTKV